MTFSKTVFLVSLGILMLTGGVLFLFFPGVDADLESAIQSVEASIQRGDAEGVLHYLSPDFESEGKTYQEVSVQIRQYVGTDQYESIVVRDREVEMVGSIGRVTCRIRFVRPRALPVPFTEYKILVEWRQGEKGWQMISGDAQEASFRK